MHTIRFGVPEVQALRNDLSSRYDSGDLNKDEKTFFKKFVKALNYLRNDPRHPGLSTHHIAPLTKRYGKKVGSPISRTGNRQRVGCSGSMVRDAAKSRS